MASRGLQIALVGGTTVLLLLTVVVNYLSTSKLGRDIGLFSNESGIPWNKRGHLTDSSLTPPGWAFSIWGVIYLYQAAMLAYCWSLLFRSNSAGEALCCVPGLLPVGYLISHAATSVFNIAWVFLADRVDTDKPLLVPQTIAIYGLTLAMWVAIGFSVQQLAVNGLRLRQMGLQREYWLVIALVQNACGLYVGWVSIASFLNLDIAIINLADYAVSSSGLFCLCQVFAVLAAYAVIDLLVLDAQLRFVFTPYLSVLWALGTSLTRNFSAGSTVSDASVELVVVLVLLLVAKTVLAVVRQRRNPLPGNGQNRSSASGMALYGSFTDGKL